MAEELLLFLPKQFPPAPEVLSRAGRGAGAHSCAQPRRGTLGRSRVPGPEWGRPGDLPWTQRPWRGVVWGLARIPAPWGEAGPSFSCGPLGNGQGWASRREQKGRVTHSVNLSGS